MDYYLTEILIFGLGFVLIALASKDVGRWFTKIKLPKITGFLFTGIVAGPFVLGLISSEAVERLIFVDEIALAFIAFAAGSELYLPELRGRYRSIGWTTAGLVVVTFILCSLAVILLSGFIPFMQDMSLTNRAAIALLAGAILVARSPSSAIAIVNELRAKGPFTQMVLGVTVIMDVVVIVVFAISSSTADALLTNVGISLNFLLLLIVELLLAVTMGYLLYRVLNVLLIVKLSGQIKAVLLLVVGFLVFILSAFIRQISHNTLPFEILVEPLLVCLVGSFLINNFSQHRAEFSSILYNTGPVVYVVFFTLTGASLRLDVLVETWSIALALFGVRLVSIITGSFSGGVIAGEPMKHNKVAWMAFVTQAGVALGLAKEVAVEFPAFGPAFATMIISVVVINETVGPLFFKRAILTVKEAHPRAEAGQFDGTRDALIFGLNGQSIALARQLCAHNWQVKIASQSKDYTQYQTQISDLNIDIQPITGLNLENFNTLKANQAEAIVSLLANDEENHRVCELAYEHFGTENLIVRLNDRANYERFRRLDVLIVDQATAMVSLLDHMVRSPSAASLLLGIDESQDIVDIEVRDRNLHDKAIRDLHLPVDTIILSIYRDSHTLIPHGYTRLKLGDHVTAVGSMKSLDKLMLQFEE